MTDMSEADRRAFEKYRPEFSESEFYIFEEGFNAALAHARGKQEPVAWMTDDGRVATDGTKCGSMARPSREAFKIPLYTAPPAESEEVARLRSEVEQLRDALKYCAEAPHSGWTIAQGIARAALSASPAPVVDMQAPKNINNAACCEQEPSKGGEDE